MSPQEFSIGGVGRFLHCNCSCGFSGLSILDSRGRVYRCPSCLAPVAYNWTLFTAVMIIFFAPIWVPFRFGMWTSKMMLEGTGN